MSPVICAPRPINESSSRVEFFSDLEAEELNDLELFSSRFVYPPGSALFLEEELPLSVFFVLEGQVKLSVNTSEGKRFILGIAKPGDALGLAAALTGNPYEMTAEAFYSSDILSISRSEFLDFLLRHPQALRSAALSLGNSYGQACLRLRTLAGTPTVAAKVSRLLLELSTSGERTEEGIKLRLTLTHGEIGECIGSCRESVSRALCDLRRRNLIAFRGSILTITDPLSLERCAAS